MNQVVEKYSGRAGEMKVPEGLFRKSDVLYQVDKQISQMCSGDASPTGRGWFVFDSSKV